MKRTLVTTCSCLLLAGSCLVGGCQGAGPKNFDEAMALVGEMQKVAEAQGAAWSADIDWGGRISVDQDISFGLNTGLKVKFHMQGNAQGGPK